VSPGVPGYEVQVVWHGQSCHHDLELCNPRVLHIRVGNAIHSPAAFGGNERFALDYAVDAARVAVCAPGVSIEVVGQQVTIVVIADAQSGNSRNELSARQSVSVWPRPGPKANWWNSPIS
jgi:hypothetical protein